MAVEIPTTEVLSFRAGDLVQWTKALPDFPANDGWVLTYTLIHQTNAKITIVATASGASHAVAIPASTTATYTAGQYQWMARVAKATEIYTVAIGFIEILANLAAVGTANFDFRSHAKKMLAAIEAAYEGRATGPELEFEINGRQIRHMGAEELIRWRSFYQAELANEKAAEQIARTGIDPRRMGVRFQRV